MSGKTLTAVGIRNLGDMDHLQPEYEILPAQDAETRNKRKAQLLGTLMW